MVLNITVDDTAGVLSYSSGWRIQPSASSASSFFQDTYHAVETAKETMGVVFNGTDVYIYGSKGTTYGAFTVVVDNSASTLHTSTLPAGSNPAVQYQQLIYHGALGAGTHSLTLTTTTGNWVDIDYVVFTTDGADEANPDPGSLTSTVSALKPVTSSVTSGTNTASSPPSSTTSPLSSSSAPTKSSSSSTITAALAGVFGGLLVLLIVGLLLYRYLTRQRRQQYEREREFRRGYTPGPAPSTDRSSTTHNPSTRERGGGGAFSNLFTGGTGGRHNTPSREGLNYGAASFPRDSAYTQAGGPGRSGTPYSALSQGQHSRASGAGSGSRADSPGTYGMTRVQNGNGYVDPRQSIDFLSVRS